MAWRGICRIRNPHGNTVRVTDGDIEHDDITEKDYLFQTLKPPLNTLPWCPPPAVKQKEEASKETGEGICSDPIEPES